MPIWRWGRAQFTRLHASRIGQWARKTITTRLPKPEKRSPNYEVLVNGSVKGDKAHARASMICRRFCSIEQNTGGRMKRWASILFCNFLRCDFFLFKTAISESTRVVATPKLKSVFGKHKPQMLSLQTLTFYIITDLQHPFLFFSRQHGTHGPRCMS